MCLPKAYHLTTNRCNSEALVALWPTRLVCVPTENTFGHKSPPVVGVRDHPGTLSGSAFTPKSTICIFHRRRRLFELAATHDEDDRAVL